MCQLQVMRHRKLFRLHSGKEKIAYCAVFKLKVSSLACKCVFYRPELNAKGDPMELNFESLEKQKWNIPTDRAQRLDEKKWGHLSNYHVYSQSYGLWEFGKYI